MQITSRKIWIATGIIIASVIIVLAGLGLWLYSGSASTAKFSVLKATNLPIGKVGDITVFARDIAAYEDLAPALHEPANTLLFDAFRTAVVAEGKVEVSSREVQAAAEAFAGDAQYGQAVQAVGSDTARETVVRPYALDSKLRAWYASQASTLEPVLAQKLQTVQSQLDRGTAFAEVAQRYSEDTATNQFAGDAGYVNLDDALPEFRDAVTLLDKNKRTIVYTRYGIHLVEVLDEITHEGKRLVNLREIVLRSKSYDSWLAKEKQTVPVSWYIK